MSARAVARAVVGGLARRRVQTAVIGLVIGVSTAASTLGMGLLADSGRFSMPSRRSTALT